MGQCISINQAFETLLPDHDLAKLSSWAFFHCVSHTAAMNVAQYLKINGCVMATSARLRVCVAGHRRRARLDPARQTGCHAVRRRRGTAPTVTGSFDVLFATSRSTTTRRRRHRVRLTATATGWFAARAAGSSRSRLRTARGGATPGSTRKIVGYHTCSSGRSRERVEPAGHGRVHAGSASQRGNGSGQVDYVNAHATATLQGDKEEAEAIGEVFGNAVPVSSLKGYIGHTLGASAALELIASLAGMQKGVVIPPSTWRTSAPIAPGSATS